MDLEINGITVIFPYKPYTIQVDYMRSVINALQNKQNALLESPTGTGKTLSLLCSTLAWLDSRKYQDLESAKNVPAEKVYTSKADEKSQGGKGKAWQKENPIRIIYSSRTHSQLTQACGELKNCYYKYCPTVTIGSRDQLCIDPEVQKLESISAKNQSCRMKVRNNQCRFHHNYERKVSDLSLSGSTVYDIEDLVKFGNEHQACPYYTAKAKSDFNTSLIFMPYNYVLDPGIRRTLKLNLENCVIIFDEGHNIERVCEDSMSTELKSEWLALFINTFDTALKSLKLLDEGKYDGTNEKELSELNIHDIAQIKLIICDLEAELDKLVKKGSNNSGHNAGKSHHETGEIFVLFDRVGLDYSKCGLICSVCEKLIAYIMNSATSYMSNSIINALTSVCSFLEIVMPFSYVKSGEFSSFKGEFVKNYKMYTEQETDSKSWNKNSFIKKSTNMWTLYLWCMSPSVAIKSLKNLGIYNLLITSGTLSPLESFECEMGIPFQVKLQNSHVISKNQLSIQFVFKDPDGNDLSGSFENRNDLKYYNGLGFTILELARTIPKGVFIFFSSYSLINKCIEVWKNRKGINLWTSISSVKRIFVEPRGKQSFNECMHSFKEAIDTTNEGAFFFGVSRGKLSEGIDLGDDYCRAVIIVGLPYPARYDPKVVLKQKYLDENNFKLNGIRWYMLQMKRALNQSIGRVIRHKNDYGTIIICDSRFRQLNDGLSKWIHAFLDKNDYVGMNAEFRTKLRQIEQFYNKNNISSVQQPQKILRTMSPPGENKEYRAKSKTNDNNSEQKKSCAADDKSMIGVLDSIKSSYTSVHLFKRQSTSPTQTTNYDSIFDTITFDTGGGSDGAQKKRQLTVDAGKSSNIVSPPSNEHKKSRPLCIIIDSEDEDEIDQIVAQPEISSHSSRNDKIRNVSKYFANNEAAPLNESNRLNLTKNDCQVNHSNSSSVPVIDLDKDCDDLNDSTVQPDIKPVKITPAKTPPAIDSEVELIARSIFKTQNTYQTFKDLVNEVQQFSTKSRQLVDTFRVYSKKGNVTYLALRLNFILDHVASDRRTIILKDLSLVIPERERKLFLRTCKVNP